MKDVTWKGVVGALIIPCLALTFLIVGMAAMINSSQAKYDRNLYKAWCKLNRRTDITYEEFETLRVHTQLPVSPFSSTVAEKENP